MNYFENKANVYEEADGGGFSHKVADVNYNGDMYRYKSRLKNILLLGVDTTGDIANIDKEAHRGQSDVMILVSVDYNNKTVNYVQLDRDIMTKITMYDTNGNKHGSTVAQLCLAYSYGDGKKLSCENAADAVSELLFGVPVDEYYSLNMDGITIVNDLVGGVPVKIEDDFSAIDTTLVYGETITLHGEQAFNYLHTRRGMSGGKNVNRMRRHRTYLTSFKEVFRKQFEKNPKIVVKMDEELAPYRYTQMTANEIAGILVETEDFTSNDTVVISGEADYSKTYTEVIPDDNEIKEIVMNTFYEKMDK